jgi:hypothetical protein
LMASGNPLRPSTTAIGNIRNSVYEAQPMQV